MVEDAVGFMWFGTKTGLYRFDGYGLHVYKSDPLDSTTISNDWVTCLFVDGEGILWVGTNSGLNMYDRTRDCFVRVKNKQGEPASLGSNGIRTLNETREGTLWVGTHAGLKFLDATDGTLYGFHPREEDERILATGGISKINRDHLGGMWVATWREVFHYDSNKRRFFRDDLASSTTKGPQGTRTITEMLVDSNGELWISPAGALFKYNPTSGLLKQRKGRENFLSVPEYGILDFDQDLNGRFWIGAVSGLFVLDPNREDSVLTLFENPMGSKDDRDASMKRIYRDNSGRIWVYAQQLGLCRYDPRRNRFARYKHEPAHARSMHNDPVTALSEDGNGNVWAGTEQSGIEIVNLQTGLCTFLSHNRRDASSLSDNHVSSILREDDGTVWVGTLGGGLNRFDEPTGKFVHYRHNDADSFSLGSDVVEEVYRDSDGDLWIGIRGGVDRFERSTGRFIHFRDNLSRGNGLAGRDVRTIHQDGEGDLWFGTFGGDACLNRYKKRTNTFIQYRADSKRLNAIQSSNIVAIAEDADRNIWFATKYGGLSRFDRATEAFKNYTVREGLPDNSISGITLDAEGNFWLSSIGGLTKFHTKSGTVRNFTTDEGLRINEFEFARTLTGSDGTLYFAGKTGFIAFKPESLKENPAIPPLYITDFKVFNKSYPLPQSILVTKEITLSHDQDFFSFEFVALEFTSPLKNQYAYKLEGVDPDWVLSGNRHYAGYTHIDPGTYTFRVKGSNNDGVWNEAGTSLTLIITPPWWRTAWAYGLYAGLIGAALYGMRRFELNRERMKLQMQMQSIEATRLKEVDQMKSRFFANISHEFRTPLMLILGPIEKWSGKTGEGEMGKDLSMMRRNAQRLLRLINQLLDLSKIEAGGMKLQASPGNIVPFVKGIANSFESSAGRRRIVLNVETESEEFELYFDRDKMEKILSNLLSNAFKFTPEGGKVTVTISTPEPLTSNLLAISVADTGIGIPSDQLDKVFDRFYQVDASQTREQEGSGIGLALTRELVELHHGTIEVHSEVGKGSEFIVKLPFGRSHLKDEEIIETSEVFKSGMSEWESWRVGDIADSPSSKDTERPPSETGDQPTSPLILIIEDNADVRAYIRSYLDQAYRVIESKDGAEGIEQAKETIPDLIVSDLMMPKLDGYEVCKRLKQDEKTSHIPIIVLTAKAGREDKIDGLETGADDYLVKPFDAKELLARVKNLIELRRKLRERFSVGQVLKPGEVAVKSMDDVFLQKVVAAVEGGMADERFSVENLGKEVGMSRYQLHRKITALTNMSAGDFIRYMRLHRAKELLEKNAGTVSEIAYSVGFGSVPYFTKCFREQFGITPGQIKKS